MKVCNSSTHLVKGCNPYCSQWPMHSISGAFFLILHGKLFCLNYCSVLADDKIFPSALKITNFHKPHSVFTDFQGLEKRISFSLSFQRHSKTVQILLNTNKLNCNLIRNMHSPTTREKDSSPPWTPDAYSLTQVGLHSPDAAEAPIQADPKSTQVRVHLA